MTIVLCSLVFVFFLSLGFALHYIHAFHSRKHIVVLALFSLFLKTRLVNLFSRDMSLVLCLALMSLFIALDLLKLCSACCVGKMFMVFITLS